MLKFSLVFLCLLTVNMFAQTDKEEAHELATQAVRFMDEGNPREAIELLKQSIELDDEPIYYPYELSLAYYLNKDYSAAIDLLEELTDHDEVSDRIWQMLGNCYDMDEQKEKAIETYEKGLELFPNSGILYLERGNMELAKGEYNNALVYYESGIDVQPTFPSNYYWAAKLFMSSEDEVWGMIYGELFMNLERNSARTAEISKMLYDTYRSEIDITSDTSMSIEFCNSVITAEDFLKDLEDLKLPFCMIFESTMITTLLSADTITTSSLNGIRTAFVKSYYESGHNNTHPNILFDYQKELLDNGHLEAYNYWILMKGEPDTFEAWSLTNGAKWDDFVEWFAENPIDISESSKFHRTQY